MHRSSLPKELVTVLANEQTDFIFFAKRKQPLQRSILSIFFSIFILSIIAVYINFFIQETQNPLNEPDLLNVGAKDPDLLDALPSFPVLIFVIIFFSVGLILLLNGIASLFKTGGYFVATASRLISCNNGLISYYDWEQFTGNTEINFKNSTLTLELRRGKFNNESNRTSRFKPENLFLCAVPNLLEVERICRQRIKENDPSPPVVSHSY